MRSTDVMSIQQAAEFLGKSRPTIYRWVQKGKLLSIKFGGQYYILKSDVERLKNES